MTMMTMMTD